MPWLPPSTTTQGEPRPCGGTRCRHRTGQHSRLCWHRGEGDEGSERLHMAPAQGRGAGVPSTGMPTWVPTSPQADAAQPQLVPVSMTASLRPQLPPQSFSSPGSDSDTALLQRNHPGAQLIPLQGGGEGGLPWPSSPNSVPSFGSWFILPTPSKPSPSSCP